MAFGGPDGLCRHDAPRQPGFLPQDHAALFATALGVGLPERCL